MKIGWRREQEKDNSEEIKMEIFSFFFVHNLQIIDLPSFNSEINTAEEIVEMNELGLQ